MRNIKTLLLILATLCFASCGGSNSIDEPPVPPEPPVKPGEIGVTIGTMPDSVEVGTSLEFTLKAVQDKQAGNFTFSADTTGAFAMTVNNFSYKEVTTLIPDKENNIKITPEKAGVCKVKFNVSSADKQAQKEIQVKAYTIPVQIQVSAVPDSVSVFESTGFTFKVEGKQGETYSVKIDTIVPHYYRIRSYGVNQDGEYEYFDDKRYGSANITINGASIAGGKTITTGETSTIRFKSPTAVGEYKIRVSVTDKYKNTTTKEVIVKVVSPEIVVKFYQVDPWIELDYDSDKFYECLNRDYTYSPLSPYFKGKRINKINTQECWVSVLLPDGTHGYDYVTTTEPGISFTFYIGQEGGEEMQCFIGSAGFVRRADKKMLSTTFFADEIDGSSNWADMAGISPIKQGFHGCQFQTATTTTTGVMYYTLRMVDKWGKEKMETITYNVIGINDTPPDYTYPNRYWKYHWCDYLPD